jgi:hypothetical protein
LRLSPEEIVRPQSTQKNTKAQKGRKYYATGCLLAFSQENKRRTQMSIDKNKIKTQDELDEAAPMDQAEERARAEMKELERQAKNDVAEGLRKADEDS